MKTKYTAKNNPRVIIIQKLYSVLYNNDDKIEFPKHRFKKFIKDIVLGTIERNEIIIEELDKNLIELLDAHPVSYTHLTLPTSDLV